MKTYTFSITELQRKTLVKFLWESLNNLNRNYDVKKSCYVNKTFSIALTDNEQRALKSIRYKIGWSQK